MPFFIRKDISVLTFAQRFFTLTFVVQCKARKMPNTKHLMFIAKIFH